MRLLLSWVPSAEDELMLIWIGAPDRNAVSRATNEIDRLLRDKALEVGEETGANRRLQVAPLEVIYTVSLDDCRVRVLEVAYVP